MDSLANGITHIILDEVHEREQNTDYLLIILREALKKREDLKVILMSATMEGNRDIFENYFSRFKPAGRCDIPSRLYSVEKLYLPDVLALTGYMPSSGFAGLWSEGYVYLLR
jgi:HrpA-like RNA helicase